MDGTAITDTDSTPAEGNETRRAGDHDEGEDRSAAAGHGGGVDDDDSDEGAGAGYQPLWVRLACIGLDFLTQTYDQIRIVPEIVLFEQYVCRSHYAGGGGHGGYLADGLPDGRIPHELCKNPDVQYQLARLRSWKALFDGIASKLTLEPPRVGPSEGGCQLSTDNFPQSLLPPYPWVSWLTGSGERRLSRQAYWDPYCNYAGSSLSVGRSFLFPYGT